MSEELPTEYKLEQDELMLEFFAKAEQLIDKVEDVGKKGLETNISLINEIGTAFRTSKASLRKITIATRSHTARLNKATELIKNDPKHRKRHLQSAEQSMLNLSNVIDNELEIFQHNYHVIHKNTDTILDWFRQQHYHHKELEDFLNMYDTVLDPTRSNIDASIRTRDTLMNHLSSGKSGERRKNALINSYNNYIQIHEDLHQYLSSVRQSRIVTITLIEKDSNEDRQLTSQFLVEEVAPFIHAIAEIIRIFNEANSIELIKPIKIVEISQNSPTQFSLMGDLGNLWERIRETFLKEWKTPAIEEKNLKVDKLRLAIERNKAETIGLRIQNDVKRQITEQEREIHQLEVEKRQLENIRLQQEIARLENDNWLELFKKALGIIEEHFPNLSEQNKFDYARQLTDPVKTIASSSLQIAPADDTKAE